MKSLFKILSLAVIVTASLAACSRDNIENPNDNEGDGGTTVGEAVTIHFGAQAETRVIETINVKVSLSPDEKEEIFESAWEDGDQISLQYCLEGQSRNTATATWNDSHFQADLNYSGTGEWTYSAVYPQPSGNAVDFGSNRKQNGNTYNSIYDLMIASASASNAVAGKDNEGNDIRFFMKRQTALAYFHYTSDLDEKITSATLTVTGGTIACSNATIDAENLANGFTFGERTSSITITFEEDNAPSAKDFTLWFNVLPTEYTQAVLEVRTTGHKATFNSAAGAFKASHLYKVSKTVEVTSWEPLSGYIVNILKEFITGGTVTATPVTGDAGTKITLQAKAYEGYEFVSWKVLRSDNSQAVTVADDNTFIMPHSDVRVIAVFNKIVDNSYNISLVPVSGGTIQAKLPDDTDATKASKGTVISLFLTYDAEEYKFEGWEVLNGSTQVEVTDNKFSMPEGDVTVSAILKKYFNVTLTQVEGGTISASESKAVEGTAINLSYTAASDYSFDKWVITGTTVALDGNSFLMPASDVNVTAVFKQRESGSGGDDDATDLSNGGTAVANCYIVAPSATEKKYKIPTSNSAGSVGAVTAAEVLWESFGTSTAPNVGDLVKEVSYANDYISFTTTGNAGNALIAAKNAEGVILWSWHIWITGAVDDITYPNSAGVMMDRNLGAISNEPDNSLAIGLLYQWGRKDPFMGSSEYSAFTVAKTSNDLIFSVADGGSNTTMNDAIQNPTKFYKASGSHWQSGEKGWSDDKKTIYDPCPAGYRVPKSEFYTTALVNQSFAVSSKGVYYSADKNEIWFPMAGDRKYNDSYEYLASRGLYWTTTLKSGDSYIYFRVRSSGFSTYQIYSAQGNSVRCQKM